MAVAEGGLRGEDTGIRTARYGNTAGLPTGRRRWIAWLASSAMTGWGFGSAMRRTPIAAMVSSVTSRRAGMNASWSRHR